MPRPPAFMPPTRIVFGRGAVGSLARLTRDAGGERALVVCGRTVAAGPQLAAVRDGLGANVAGVFDSVGRHGDLELLVELPEMLGELEPGPHELELDLTLPGVASGRVRVTGQA